MFCCSTSDIRISLRRCRIVRTVPMPAAIAPMSGPAASTQDVAMDAETIPNSDTLAMLAATSPNALAGA